MLDWSIGGQIKLFFQTILILLFILIYSYLMWLFRSQFHIENNKNEFYFIFFFFFCVWFYCRTIFPAKCRLWVDICNKMILFGLLLSELFACLAWVWPGCLPFCMFTTIIIIFFFFLNFLFFFFSSSFQLMLMSYHLQTHPKFLACIQMLKLGIIRSQ